MGFKEGTWVKIHTIILKETERSEQIPEDTKLHPLEMWLNGYATTEGKLGDQTEVITLTGRKLLGEVVEIEPHYVHSFGDFLPEMYQIDQILLKYLGGA